MLTETQRLSALMTVQIFGTSIVFLSVLHLNFHAFTNLSTKLLRRLLICIGVLLFLSFFISALKPESISNVFGMIGKTTPDWIANLVTIDRALLFCAFMDIIVLFILIHATGGSRNSIYSFYLFVVVLLLIMLKANDMTVKLSFAASFFIFWLCLFYRNKEFSPIENKILVYDLHFGVAATICVILPILVKCWH